MDTNKRHRNIVIQRFNQPKFMQPILDGMEKVKSQLEYQRVEYPIFAKLMEKILGASATKAWPEIAPLVNRMQIEHAAEAYKVLAEGGITPTKQILEAIADRLQHDAATERAAALEEIHHIAQLRLDDLICPEN